LGPFDSNGKPMSDVPNLTPAERELLAFLVATLESGKTYLTDAEWGEALQKCGLSDRAIAVFRYFDSLGIIERFVHPPPPPQPTRAITKDSREAAEIIWWHKVKTEGVRIMGRAIDLDRSLPRVGPARQTPKGSATQ